MGADDYQVSGSNSQASFTLKVHRGDGMALLAMDWKHGKPPDDFVGFGIEYSEPGSTKFWPVKNRLRFPLASGDVDPNKDSSLRAPIQKFRWVHFPMHASLAGIFTYRVTPVFMDANDILSNGETQEVEIELRRETHPGKLNVSYTRGYVSSQAFVDHYGASSIPKLIPATAKAGLAFKPSHPDAKAAYAWMGFEAREEILALLDEAIADGKAQVRVVAYDLNLPELVNRLAKLGSRLRVIVDDSKEHGAGDSAETAAFKRLAKSAGKANVKRQHMGVLQHNKFIAVKGPKVQAAVCGSTNFSWRGFYVQSNNALVARGASVAAVFFAAFDDYWANDKPAAFGATDSARWTDLGIAGLDAKVAFSPHSVKNALLQDVADDIVKTKSSLFYSLAFLYQTPGVILDAIKKVTADPDIFVYGLSDREVGGIDVLVPSGKITTLSPSALTDKNAPEPFKSEPSGGGGVRMHHKFLVIDFDKPSARVWLGSYNFSEAADRKNGENLVLVRDRRIAVSYMIEALRMVDAYHFRLKQSTKAKKKMLQLRLPPRKASEKPWWQEYYTDPVKANDRELFA